MTALVETFPDWLRELNRLVGSNQGQIAPFTPPADLIEDNEGVTVYMDVPGVRAEDLEIELQNDMLTIRGTRPFPYQSQDGDNTLRRAERGFGRFERTIRVPRGLSPDAIQASLKDGVLSLRIPKPEQLKPHRIEVRPHEGQAQPTQGQAQPTQGQAQPTG
jgi:HSP20 family protein